MSLKHYGFILTLLISACTVGPDYERPNAQVPREFVSQEVIALLNEDNEDTTYNIEWWRGFNDPDLNALVQKGLADNYDIAAAASQVKQARASIRFADSGDALQAGANAGAEVQERRDLDNGGSDTSSSFVGGLAAVLPLDIFGQNRREVEAAMAQLNSSEAALRGSVLDVSTAITNEYLTLLGTQRQLELLQESVQLQEKTLSIVEARYDAGLAPELDVQRARTSVQNIRADIPILKQSIKNSRNLLATYTGEYPGYYNDLAADQTKIPNYKTTIPTLVPYEVLALRPDVSQAEYALKEAVARIGIAKADFYPTFELRGDISVNAAGFGNANATDILIASIGALIDQVLFDGGARGANYDIAVAQAEEALAIYEQTLRDASLDVEEALAALEASADRQISLEKSVQSSSRSFNQAEILYQQGLISFLDVVDAQRQLASAEQALAREKTNYATQIVNLFNAFGAVVD